MLYCRCGQYLLWDRDHWACQGCGASPWRCDCRKQNEEDVRRIDYGAEKAPEDAPKSILEKVFG